MGLTKIKIYTAECDECGKEETYPTEYKNAIPIDWEWKEVKGHIQYYTEKLFCPDCSKLPKSKWDW